MNNVTTFKTEQTFATRSAAKMYLVAQGKPVNYAKAAVDESYNFEPDGDVRDLLWGAADDEHPKHQDEFFPIVVTESQLINAYNTMEEMFSVEYGYISVDGDAMYTIHGDPRFTLTAVEDIMACAEGYINQASHEEWPVERWTAERAIAEENENLKQLAALCIAQVRCETGE